MVKIIKSSGEKEVFKKIKIMKTAIRAGASRKLAVEVAEKISGNVYDGMSSKKILKLVLNHLKVQPAVASRYNLKRAIMDLGPHGFSFEEYFCQILKSYGYEARTSNYIKGKVVTQEVDVIAKKGGKTFMVEAKYHNQLGGRVRCKEAMYTYARFLDIKHSIKVDQSWLVTNTKCTGNAIGYSKGVGQKVTSWNYPVGENLQDLIMKKGLYPITVFNSVRGKTKEKLFSAKIVMASDLASGDVGEIVKKTGLSRKKVVRILEEAKRIVGV